MSRDHEEGTGPAGGCFKVRVSLALSLEERSLWWASGDVSWNGSESVSQDLGEHLDVLGWEALLKGDVWGINLCARRQQLNRRVRVDFSGDLSLFPFQFYIANPSPVPPEKNGDYEDKRNFE